MHWSNHSFAPSIWGDDSTGYHQTGRGLPCLDLIVHIIWAPRVYQHHPETSKSQMSPLMMPIKTGRNADTQARNSKGWDLFKPDHTRSFCHVGNVTNANIVIKKKEFIFHVWLWPGDTIWHQVSWLKLIQVMACPLFGTKLWPNEMLA